MKGNEHKNIEHYIQRAIKETPLESPPHDFTVKVMANILATDKSKATSYKPLISKKGWLLVFVIIATMGYFIVSGSTQNQAKVWSFGPGMKNFIHTFSDVPLFQFSRITTTVIVLATIMIFIQITCLINHLNKRFEK